MSGRYPKSLPFYCIQLLLVFFVTENECAMACVNFLCYRMLLACEYLKNGCKIIQVWSSLSRIPEQMYTSPGQRSSVCNPHPKISTTALYIAKCPLDLFAVFEGAPVRGH